MKQLAAIYQIKDLSKSENETIIEMFCRFIPVSPIIITCMPLYLFYVYLY